MLLSLLIRTCVDESELCKGVPLCDNKEDLKWCKAASIWTVPDNWTPMMTFKPGEVDEKPQIKCTFLNDTDPRGQWIHPQEYFDGKIFQCINRTDENPFSKQKNATDDNRWLESVNSTCSTENRWYRSCLGDKPTECVGE